MTDAPIKMFGHTMRPLTRNERMYYADAGPKAVCCQIGDADFFIFDPESGTLEEFDHEGGIASQFKFTGKMKF